MTDLKNYSTETWYILLSAQAARSTRATVAKQLNISAPQLSQVLNRTGKYGSGMAKTDKLAVKVMHTFGRYVCPYLSSEGQEVQLEASQCKDYAHKPAPTSSPRAMQHWQACRNCIHADHTAPSAPRPVVKRTGHQGEPA
jgi:hypothetical protein